MARSTDSTIYLSVCVLVVSIFCLPTTFGQNLTVPTIGGNGGGQDCDFPFVYRNIFFHNCITLNSTVEKPWCAVTDSYDTDRMWGYCVRKVPVYQYEADYGDLCYFPYIYVGKTYYSCISTNDALRPWCYTTSSNTLRGYCMPDVLTHRGTEVKEASPDLQCKFPFDTNGERFYACTTKDSSTSRFWCETKSGKWSYCDNVARGKKAYHTSTRNTHYAQNSVDGKVSIFYSQTSCSLTETVPMVVRPWWMVNLAKAYFVESIEIVNVAGTEVYDNKALHNFTMNVGWFFSKRNVSFSRDAMSVCAFEDNVMSPGDPTKSVLSGEYLCPNNTRGQFLMLQIMHDTLTYLATCEIGVKARYIGDIEGMYKPFPATSDHMESSIVPLQSTTILLTGIRGFKDDCKLVGVVLYVTNPNNNISFHIWRPTNDSSKYQLVDMYEASVGQKGYMYLNLTEIKPGKEMRGKNRDIFGFSLQNTPTTAVTERTCDIVNMDGGYRTYGGYSYRNGYYVEDTTSGDIVGSFVNSSNCLDYLVEAVVQYDNACKSYPCLNGATCIEVPDGFPQNYFRCECTIGFTGYMCESELDECSSSPCKNGGYCFDRINAFHCNCTDGFNGTNCENDINECESNPCLNGGVCEDVINGYICNCTGTGFNGTLCENNLDDCFTKPCQNDGECVDEISSYRCNCTEGYNGTNCELELDECSSCPCQNGGYCFDRINTFYCNCTDGFNGTNCENDINECESNPCLNGGVCGDVINGYICNCTGTGFNGTLCENNMDDCFTKPCQNDGECVDEINSYHCNCTEGYKGTNCELDIDECASNPCLLDEVCKDMAGGFVCNCTLTGYNGTLCENNINECESNPCLNGGVCEDVINGYICNCTGTGFNGTRCENIENITTTRPHTGAGGETSSITNTAFIAEDHMTTNPTKMRTSFDKTTPTLSNDENTSFSRDTTTDPQIYQHKTEITSPETRTSGYYLKWGAWLEWSLCSAKCDGGIQLRIVLCNISDGLVMDGCSARLWAKAGWVLSYDIGTRVCNNQSCPKDGSWTEWGEWSNCSSSCDYGLETRIRRCEGVVNGGKDCKGAAAQHQFCISRKCQYEKIKKFVADQNSFKESDRRPSAQALGGVYVVLLASFVGLFFILDISTFKKHIQLMKGNLRSRFKKEITQKELQH